MSDMELALAWKTQQGYTDCSTSLEEHDKQIRADAIEECIEMLEGDCFVSGTVSKVLIHHLEQLKERKNGR